MERSGKLKIEHSSPKASVCYECAIQTETYEIVVYKKMAITHARLSHK